MYESFQDKLVSFPLYQLKFLTPIPRERIFYEEIVEEVPESWLQHRTLLTITHEEEWEKLNQRETVMRIIQDPNLVAIAVSLPKAPVLFEEIQLLFCECQIPIILLTDSTAIKSFHQPSQLLFSQLSSELAGAMETGFAELATEVAFGLDTPLLYLDENHQLLWQTGSEKGLREANRWYNSQRRHIEGSDDFDVYPIDIAGVIQQSFIVSGKLVDWQKSLVDKLCGVTALLLQTEGIFQQQQKQLQDHFVYDLLFHKFESQKVMIKQAKSWGWNLEIPHHLLIIDIDVSDVAMKDNEINWLEKMVEFLEEKSFTMEEKIIPFSFRDQIVVLLEDGRSCSNSERHRYVFKVAESMKKELAAHWSQCQISIGIGKWYTNTTFLNKSYQEANQALTFGRAWFENRHIYHINDLGALRLLMHIHQEILLDYSDEYLLPLLESDRDTGTELIHTLKVYIQHQGVIGNVSDALYIHSNTLRNRIKKMEELTGVNFQDPEEFMNLMVAIKIYSFMK